jgi:hygromycin-B 7''-O-kinase
VRGVTTFPLADTEERFAAVVRDEALLRPGVDALCAHLGVSGDVERFADGSLPVYAIGDEHVLKLFPAVHLDEVAVESGVLAAVHGALPVPTPEVRAAGEFGGWGHVLMRRLHGESLEEVWPRLGPAERGRVCGQIGESLRALHDVPPPAHLAPADWGDFVTRQRAGCVARQAARGLAPEWLEQVDEFLDGVELGDPEPVLLHTEVVSEHLLVSPDLVLSGLFDFEPAMRGAPEYEFVATGIFVAGGDRAAHRALLDSYGCERDEALPRRLLAYTLLHRYSNLPWYLKEMPESSERRLPELAERWFGFG